jgi:hypothetical protein
MKYIMIAARVGADSYQFDGGGALMNQGVHYGWTCLRSGQWGAVHIRAVTPPRTHQIEVEDVALAIFAI